MNKFRIDYKQTITVDGKTLKRIQAVRSFGKIPVGEYGGYIEHESNLSHEGNCWIDSNAKVLGNSTVEHNATILGNAKIVDSKIMDYSSVSCNSIVSNSSLHGASIVRGDSIVSNSTILSNANIRGKSLIRNVTIEDPITVIDAIIEKPSDWVYAYFNGEKYSFYKTKGGIIISNNTFRTLVQNLPNETIFDDRSELVKELAMLATIQIGD